MACLIITKSPSGQVGVYFQLAKRPLAGGRDPAREIQILDPHVSRKHFVIQTDGEAHLIMEAKARNGIHVNGLKITEKKLVDGDTIQVGETELTYYVSDDPNQTNAVHHFRAVDRSLREDQTMVNLRKDEV